MGTSVRSASDHPRSRGEYDSIPAMLSRKEGSSPLSRGIRRRHHRLPRAPRIIPALAGNTAAAVGPLQQPRDHPRSRGEYAFAAPARKSQTGSSPLSRGIRGSSLMARAIRRIIPALAGNTTNAKGHEQTNSDHPRSRGEYGHGTGQSMFLPGSSPLSRGILGSIDTTLDIVGIIPALAGNTPSLKKSRNGRRDHPRSRGEYGVARG